MRVEGKGPSSHLILHLNRARMAIDSRHVKMEDWSCLELWLLCQYTPSTCPSLQLGACSSPPCLVLPYTGANMLLLAGDAHSGRGAYWDMAHDWTRWEWPFLVRTLRMIILGEHIEAVNWKMPGALAGLLRSSMYHCLHKAPIPAPCALKLLFTRAETLLLPRRTYIYTKWNQLGPDLPNRIVTASEHRRKPSSHPAPIKKKKNLIFKMERRLE